MEPAGLETEDREGGGKGRARGRGQDHEHENRVQNPTQRAEQEWEDSWGLCVWT